MRAEGGRAARRALPLAASVSVASAVTVTVTVAVTVTVTAVSAASALSRPPTVAEARALPRPSNAWVERVAVSHALNA